MDLSGEQLDRHRRALTSPRWWARSPVVVGRTARPSGWWIRLPEGDIDLHLSLLEAIDGGGTPLVRLDFHEHQRVRAAQLARSPHIRHLEYLGLACAPRTVERSDALGSLTVDSFDGHCSTDRELRALSASETLVGLRELDLSGNRVTLAGLEALAASRAFRQLTHLRLRGNSPIQGSVVEVLARFPRLRALDLSDVMGVDLRVGEPVSFPELQRLRIRDSHVRDEALAQFLRKTRTPKLTHLVAAQNRALGPATAEALATDPVLSHLRVLDLHGARIGDAAGSKLAASELLSSLRELRLGQTGAGEATARAVVENSQLELRALNLSAQGRPRDATITATTAVPWPRAPT